MKCIYHNVDLDGECSAAIILSNEPDCELYGMDYGEPCPWWWIGDEDHIFVVDFSFPNADMIALAERKFVWIDHHQSAVNRILTARHLSKVAERFFGEGDCAKAACELTWEYFHDNESLPNSVWMLGRFDTWQHNDDEEILSFQMGMQSYDTSPTNQRLWRAVLSDAITGATVSRGAGILAYMRKAAARYCNRDAFELELDGHVGIAVVVGKPFAGSKFLESVYDPSKHAFACCIEYLGTTFTVHLYSTTIDVSKIAGKYGGGGHLGAAGFQVERLGDLI